MVFISSTNTHTNIEMDMLSSVKRTTKLLILQSAFLIWWMSKVSDYLFECSSNFIKSSFSNVICPFQVSQFTWSTMCSLNLLNEFKEREGLYCVQCFGIFLYYFVDVPFHNEFSKYVSWMWLHDFFQARSDHYPCPLTNWLIHSCCWDLNHVTLVVNGAN